MLTICGVYTLFGRLQAASNRHRYGDRNKKGKGASAQSKGRTKDEDENDYIEREGKTPEPDAEKKVGPAIS